MTFVIITQKDCVSSLFQVIFMQSIVIDTLLYVFVFGTFYCAVLSVHSSYAIIPPGKRELVVLLQLSP